MCIADVRGFVVCCRLLCVVDGRLTAALCVRRLAVVDVRLTATGVQAVVAACVPVLDDGNEMTVIPFDGVFVLLGVFDDGGLVLITESGASFVFLESCF